jgi:EAL domain-containing protein (putative c-di-GMP-specific phosphodiesterase class I)
MSNRVLIVDDEAEICRFIGRVAQDCGYEVATAVTASQFVAQLAVNPSLIVLDLQMPDVDGIELLRHLADTASPAKVLIASGTDQRVLEAAGRLGAAHGLSIVGTMTKPIRIADLRALFERLYEGAGWLTADALTQAINADQLFLVYQPKIDLRTRRVTGVEALLRWRHPARGLLQPLQFLPFAEEAQLMDAVTRWVLNAATRQMQEWTRTGLTLGVAINLSAQNLANTGIADGAAALCRAADLPTHLITIELTETAAMSSVIDAMEILTRLRLKGMKLSLDDFGTGYSSLIQLHRLPFSELKIDRAFVADCHGAQGSRVMVKTMIDLAHNLGLVSVAEGVEVPDGLQLLQELGCDMAQGFLIARPMEAERLVPWLDAWGPGIVSAGAAA